jgi:uncharacterized protein YjbI with pentapeptide repeats
MCISVFEGYICNLPRFHEDNFVNSFRAVACDRSQVVLSRAAQKSSGSWLSSGSNQARANLARAKMTRANLARVNLAR